MYKYILAILIIAITSFSQDYARDTQIIRSILDLNGRQDIPCSQVITRTANGRVTYLDLRSLSIDTIPSNIDSISALVHLTLIDNEIRYLPESIGNLSSLTGIDARDNSLISLPDSIYKLTALTDLLVGGNSLSSLPLSIGNMPSLHRLELGSKNMQEGNFFTHLPDTLKYLSLVFLDISNNIFDTLPAVIGKIITLEGLWASNSRIAYADSFVWYNRIRTLDLSDNLLTEVPKLPPFPPHRSFLNEWVDLSKNRIRYLDAGIIDFEYLTYLNLSNNLLDSLPDYIGYITSLEYLYADNNNLVTLPNTIGDNTTGTYYHIQEIHVKNNLLSSLPASLLLIKKGTGNFQYFTGINVDSNRLCSLSPEFETWLSANSLTSTWKTSQVCPTNISSLPIVNKGVTVQQADSKQYNLLGRMINNNSHTRSMQALVNKDGLLIMKNNKPVLRNK